MAQEQGGGTGGGTVPVPTDGGANPPGGTRPKHCLMDARSFFELVGAMRDAQKEYFRTRDRDALVASKTLEARVDAEIARVRKVLSERQNAEPGPENSEK